MVDSFRHFLMLLVLCVPDETALLTLLLVAITAIALAVSSICTCVFMTLLQPSGPIVSNLNSETYSWQLHLGIVIPAI